MGEPLVRAGSSDCPEGMIRNLAEAFETLLKIRTTPSSTMPPDPRVCCTVLDSNHTRYLIKEPFHCQVLVCMSDWTSRRLVDLIQAHVDHGERARAQILPGFVAKWIRSAMKISNGDWESAKIFSLPEVSGDPHVSMPRRNVRSISIHSAVGRIDLHAVSQA